MAEGLYTKPDLIRKVRFQTGEKEDRNTELYDNSSNVRINHNNWAEGSTPLESQDNTTGNQQKSLSVCIYLPVSYVLYVLHRRDTVFKITYICWGKHYITFYIEAFCFRMNYNFKKSDIVIIFIFVTSKL